MAPYIWCETFNRGDCKSANISECMKSIKCYPERKTHQLGCMAVFVYNSSEADRNMPEIVSLIKLRQVIYDYTSYCSCKSQA